MIFRRSPNLFSLLLTCIQRVSLPSLISLGLITRNSPSDDVTSTSASLASWHFLYGTPFISLFTSSTSFKLVLAIRKIYILGEHAVIECMLIGLPAWPPNFLCNDGKYGNWYRPHFSVFSDIQYSFDKLCDDLLLVEELSITYFSIICI